MIGARVLTTDHSGLTRTTALYHQGVISTVKVSQMAPA
jgi:hypothetical protein